MAHPRTLLVVLVAAVALLAAGCAAGEEAGPTTVATVPPTVVTTTATTVLPTTTLPLTTGVPVPDALATDLTGSVVLTGYLVIDQGSPRLCAELLAVEPPACGGVSISVGGPVDTPLLLDAGTGVRWSPFPVDLAGSFTGSKLFADGPPPQLTPPPTPEVAPSP